MAESLSCSQVWGMVLLNQEGRLLTGSADSELRAWDIHFLQGVRRHGAKMLRVTANIQTAPSQ